MTLTLADLLPIRREPKPRKANRAEIKLRKTEAHLAAVQEDNVRLLNRQAAADDLIARQAQRINRLEADDRDLRLRLTAEQGAHAADVETRNRWIRDLERQLADAARRLEIRTWAEAAAATTQEIDVRSLRERFASGPVVSLHHSPQASTNPGRGTPTWAHRD